MIGSGCESDANVANHISVVRAGIQKRGVNSPVGTILNGQKHSGGAP